MFFFFKVCFENLGGLSLNVEVVPWVNRDILGELNQPSFCTKFNLFWSVFDRTETNKNKVYRFLIRMLGSKN